MNSPIRSFIPGGLSHPANEFSVMPFWFWNDDLDAGEIIRQIDDFQRHGVDGFVIHPRVGLPRRLGWMSPDLLQFYKAAIDEAQRRNMKVILYDEGMYPSGSASGQVVAANPTHACRCLAKIDLAPGQTVSLKPGENLAAVVGRKNGGQMAVIDRPANSVIRGLHYIGDGPGEDEPPAADILNPEATAAFIRLVYDTFAINFGHHFGGTVMAIFTDEPGLLGRSREKQIWPGTTGIFSEVNRILGYDFTPHLPALWYEDEPEADRFRREYLRAISLRLEETYYQPLSTWCAGHGIALTGHPAKGDDIGPLRYFQIPGQDLVWRWVLPDAPSALEGSESTQAKCASSAMLHTGRRRNTNECCGAYGHELTWDEMCWLARWVFVRGGNLLTPHAFYYSVRGIRRDERPPDVGPNSAWWQRYPEYAAECRRLSWINTDAEHICNLAILGQADFLPWRAARICYRHQYDFNYLEERDLLERAVVDEQGIHLCGMVYTGLILDYPPGPETKIKIERLSQAGGVYLVDNDECHESLFTWLSRRIPQDFVLSPKVTAARIRHVIKDDRHYYLIFNEEKDPLVLNIEFQQPLDWFVYDAVKDQAAAYIQGEALQFIGHELKVITAKRKSLIDDD